MARFVEFKVEILPGGEHLAHFNAEHVVSLVRKKDGLEARLSMLDGSDYRVLEEYDQAMKKLKG